MSSTSPTAPQVTLCEVGPRDGLQNERVVLSVARRRELVDLLLAAGLPIVEAGSMVRADLVPAMAGSSDVVAALDADRARIALLVLNARGFEAAVASGAGRAHIAYPVTDAFASRNQGMDAARALELACDLARSAVAGVTAISATLGAAFGCPFSGAVDPGVVVEHARRLAAAGCERIVLADTIGVASPGSVRRLVERLSAAVPVPVGLHLHNTRNAGYANAVAGLESGVRWFDASAGGFGGCPFAPRATGNVATEDVLWLLEREGAEHGVDLDAVGRAGEALGTWLGRPAPGLVHRAGRWVGE